jgi:hypothetical protein
MAAPTLLRPVVAVLAWPEGRFADVHRTWDVALAPADARSVLRGAIGTNPYHLPVMEGIRASRRSEVVGDVDDEGHFQIYIGHRKSSGLGLIGAASARGTGSLIEARVGWVGLHRWAEPVLTLVAIAAPGIAVVEALREGDGLLLGLALALTAILAGGRLLSLASQAEAARTHELPAILARLEPVLAPHLRQTTGTPRGAQRTLR